MMPVRYNVRNMRGKLPSEIFKLGSHLVVHKFCRDRLYLFSSPNISAVSFNLHAIMRWLCLADIPNRHLSDWPIGDDLGNSHTIIYNKKNSAEAEFLLSVKSLILNNNIKKEGADLDTKLGLARR